MPPSSKVGSGDTPGLHHTHPTDVLVRDWAQGKPAAFDITLTPAILAEASMRVGAAAKATERRKHTVNNPKCAELGWVCVPLAVETYFNWERRQGESSHSWLHEYHHGDSHSKGQYWT